MMSGHATDMPDTVSQMASILRVCAATIRDIAMTRDLDAQASILSAAEDADRAARILEAYGDPEPACNAGEPWASDLTRLMRQRQ